MNKVVLMGRLVRDPEVRYSQSAEPIAVTRFTIAVNRRFKRENEPDADFINCVSFGKTGEFIGKYFQKGNMILVTGRIQTGSYEKDGIRHYTTDIAVEEAEFCESKSVSGVNKKTETDSEQKSGYAVEESIDDDDLPF